MICSMKQIVLVHINVIQDLILVKLVKMNVMVKLHISKKIVVKYHVLLYMLILKLVMYVINIVCTI